MAANSRKKLSSDQVQTMAGYIYTSCMARYYFIRPRYVVFLLTVVGSSPIKGPRCLLQQERLPLLVSTGWFQERIRA